MYIVHVVETRVTLLHAFSCCYRHICLQLPPGALYAIATVGNFGLENNFLPFHHLLSCVKFLSHHVNEYIEPMATITVWVGKCNANVAGLSKIFVL